MIRQTFPPKISHVMEKPSPSEKDDNDDDGDGDNGDDDDDDDVISGRNIARRKGRTSSIKN